MKRIDEKIKEIEKKDKQSRWAYYVIALGLLGFLWYASTTRSAMAEKDKTIAEQLEQALKDKDTIQAQYDKLAKALNPLDYWRHVENQESNEAYINYVTNKYKIDKTDYMPIAYTRLAEVSLEGFEGWLFTGLVLNNGNYDNRGIVEVIYRDGEEVNDDSIKNSLPQAGDIVRLVGATNYNTYRFHNESGANPYGLRNKTKAYVVSTWKDPGSARHEIYIKYY